MRREGLHIPNVDSRVKGGRSIGLGRGGVRVDRGQGGQGGVAGCVNRRACLLVVRHAGWVVVVGVVWCGEVSERRR